MSLGNTANVTKLLKFHFWTHLPAFLNFGDPKSWRNHYIARPRASKVGGPVSPVPMVVAPLTERLIRIDNRDIRKVV